MKMTYDMKPGDAIIHDRYTYHRSDPFATNHTINRKIKHRISIRYMPANAKFYPLEGFQGDAAIAEKNMAKGDAISKAGEYFPQVWPVLLSEEMVNTKEDKKINFNLLQILKFTLLKKA